MQCQGKTPSLAPAVLTELVQPERSGIAGAAPSVPLNCCITLCLCVFKLVFVSGQLTKKALYLVTVVLRKLMHFLIAKGKRN